MFRLRKLEQNCAKDWVASQIKSPVGLLLHDSFCFLFAPQTFDPGKIDHRQRNRDLGGDDLYRLVCIPKLIIRAQDLVPPNQVVQGAFEGWDIEGSRQTEGAGNVVEGGDGVQFIEEP